MTKNPPRATETPEALVLKRAGGLVLKHWPAWALGLEVDQK